MNKNKIMEILHKHSGTVDNHGATGIYFADFDNVVEDLHNLDNWISVETELPKDDSSVLVWDRKTKDITFGYCIDKKWYLNQDGTFPCFVTHWQSRPKPPKEKK